MSMSVDPAFDPSAYSLGENRYFEDFAVGERYPSPSRTVTDAQFLAFQAVSGDNHPIHYDREYCKARGHRDLLAHGYQVLIQTAAGAGMLPHYMEDSLTAFLEQSSKFLGPVYMGDTLFPMLEIVELIEQRTTGVMVIRTTIHNQAGERVLEGEQKLLLKKQPSRCP